MQRTTAKPTITTTVTMKVSAAAAAASSKPTPVNPLGTTAAGVPALMHAEHPMAAAVLAGSMQPATLAEAEASAEHKSSTPSLTVRRNFDDHSKRITRDHFSAVQQCEHNARSYFYRLRSYNSYQVTAEHHANFRTERKLARQQGTDASVGEAYATISQPRKNAAIALDNESDGKSLLEQLLPKEPPLDKPPFRSLLDPATGAIRDVKSGLNADLISRDGPPKRYFLTFPGTGMVDTAGAQWKINVRQFLGIGGVPKAYQDAVELATLIRDNLPDGVTLELSGHSLGGGIASYVGLHLGIPAVGFNSAPLGPACMKALRDAGALTPERLSKLQQVRIEGDAVTSRGVSRWLSALANGGLLFRSRIPQLLGTVHEIRRGSDHYPQGSLGRRHRTDGFEAAYQRVVPRPSAARR